MKIVFLEADTLGHDIVLDSFQQLGELTVYGMTRPDQVKERIINADVVVVNKIQMNEKTLGSAPSIKLICLTATGTNNIDFSYTREHNITVTNVKGYSTQSVAQHTFALAFYLLEKLYYYDQYVKSGSYITNTMFTHFEKKFHELYNKTWGIVGLGEIGHMVASIANAFGCHVIYYSTTGKNYSKDYERVDFDSLLFNSDIISIHAPLTLETQNLFNLAAFQKMKKDSLLINVGRGSIINEADLYQALINDEIGGAALDVLTSEPIQSDNPLMQLTDSSRLIITPHMAWATVEARERLVKEVYQNIEAFFQNIPRNIV